MFIGTMMFREIGYWRKPDQSWVSWTKRGRNAWRLLTADWSEGGWLVLVACFFWIFHERERERDWCYWFLQTTMNQWSVLMIWIFPLYALWDERLLWVFGSDFYAIGTGDLWESWLFQVSMWHLIFELLIY